MKQNFRSKNGQVDNEKRSSSANKGSLSVLRPCLPLILLINREEIEHFLLLLEINCFLGALWHELNFLMK